MRKRSFSKCASFLLFFVAATLFGGFLLVIPSAHAAAQELYSTPLFNDPNLLYYYRFEGNANDSKGSNNGIATNVTYSVSYGVFGQGASFDGSDSYITTTSSSEPLNNFTYTVWVYPSVSGAGTIRTIKAGTDSGIGNNYGGGSPLLRVNADNTVSLFAAQWGGGGASTGTITNGQWNFIAATFTSGNVGTFYINGAFAGTFTNVFNNPSAHIPLIGADQNRVSPYQLQYPWYGYIDDFAIFSRVLSPGEISNLYTGNWSTTTVVTLTPSYLVFPSAGSTLLTVTNSGTANLNITAAPSIIGSREPLSNHQF